MHRIIALLAGGVEMAVPGIACHEYTKIERFAVVHAHSRTTHFKEVNRISATE